MGGRQLQSGITARVIDRTRLIHSTVNLVMEQHLQKLCFFRLFRMKHEASLNIIKFSLQKPFRLRLQRAKLKLGRKIEKAKEKLETLQ